MVGIKTYTFFLIALTTISCGGGGGGGSSDSPAPTVTGSSSSNTSPSPTLSLTASETSIAIRGGKSIISWDSSNATSCSASGTWSGDKETSGEEIFSTDSFGNNTFTLTCSGSGGSVEASLSISSFTCDPNNSFKKPKLAAGSSSTCLLEQEPTLSEDGVYCWGGTNFDPNDPANQGFSSWYGMADVPDLLNPVQITAGGLHNCALDDTGVICWGYNNYGQTDVPNLSCPKFVDAKGENTCALDDTGLVCWGRISDQLGFDIRLDELELTNPYRLSVNDAPRSVCVADENGISCAGEGLSPPSSSGGVYTQLKLEVLSPPDRLSDVVDMASGTGSFYAIGTAKDPNDPSFKTQSVFPNSSSGIYSNYTSTIPEGRNDQLVIAWGWADRSQEGTGLYSILNPKEISSGKSHACAIGKAHCRYYGTAYISTVEGQGSFGGICNDVHPGSQTYSHYETSDEDAVYCWQNNLAPSAYPMVTRISVPGVSYYDSSFSPPQREDGSSYFPTKISNPLTVGVGGNHTCVLDDDMIHCWGQNDSGQAPTFTYP